MRAGENFFNLYNHDFVRVAVGIPAVRVADPAFNADQTIALMREAVDRKAIAGRSSPSSGLSAYSCDDLFHQRALLDGCRDALREIVEASASWPIVAVVGMPLEVDHLLFNCAVVIHRGRDPRRGAQDLSAQLSRVLRSCASSTRRQRVRERDRALRAAPRPVRHPASLSAEEQPLLTFHVEICEDLWVPIPPSSYRGAGRRDGAAESLRLEHHGRQGRLPARAGRRASRRDAWRRISTRRPVPANRPPTWRGTATR